MSVSIKNRRSNRPVRSVLFAVVLTAPCGPDQHLPVFLSDNHAETFGWITRTFDPDESYQFVLVDAHSDASMAERSEECANAFSLALERR